MQGETGVQVPVTVRTFTQLFSCTPRGARLARRLAANRMDLWGYAYDSGASESVALVVAELAANAVRHGRVRGRDFRVRLLMRAGEDTVRVEVADGVTERLPAPRESPGADDEGGRGLLLVTALADRWGTDLCTGGTHKVVWAEIRVPGR
ncbi:anti-sigma regulatory factor (Ser/Thr protein kinase) [Streptomyces sp. V3I8]|uniref:ATP-binding protein n=1 Tax=Streptomyces sp. V3I8 TaxID=3042279 RepID=UPI00278233F4|nr:ATP-binding protein [Streptomyces sp. V3I8]MDQ1035451.1 anti-sigma regulatory factor (Ser/Thr protein kinase) [Streptomyces sp. V3I8]